MSDTESMNASMASSRLEFIAPAGMMRSQRVFHAERPTSRVQSSSSSFGYLPFSS